MSLLSSAGRLQPEGPILLYSGDIVKLNEPVIASQQAIFHIVTVLLLFKQKQDDQFPRKKFLYVKRELPNSIFNCRLIRQGFISRNYQASLLLQGI